MIFFIFDKNPDAAVTEGEPADPSPHRCIEHLGGKDHPQAKNHRNCHKNRNFHKKRKLSHKKQKLSQKTEIVKKNGNCHKTRFRQTLSAGKRHLHEKTWSSTSSRM